MDTVSWGIMAEQTIRYHCGPVTKEFHQDEESRAKLLIGPFGTGKTSSGAWEIVQLASRRVMATQGAVRSRFGVVRNTYPELRDTTIKTFMDWFPAPVWGTYNVEAKKYVVRYRDGEVKVECEIMFKALDSPSDVRDLLGLELTGAHIDEAREVHEDIFKGLRGRVGRFPSLKDTGGRDPFLKPPQVILTTNYPSELHWICRDFEEGREGYRAFHQDQSENKHNLRPGYYEDMEKDYADRPDLLRTLVRGGYGITVLGRSVYPEFRRELHVSVRVLKPVEAKVVRGWDNTGLNPACVVTQVGSTGQWLVLKEFCGEDVGIVDFGEMVKAWCGQEFGGKQEYRDIGDPAGKTRDTTQKSPTIYLREMGIYVEDGVQTFKVRRESVAGRLTKLINGGPAIVLDPRCVRLKSGFEGGYAYPEIANTGMFRVEPAKNEYSHIHDALQYAATRLWGPQQDMKFGKPLRQKMGVA